MNKIQSDLNKFGTEVLRPIQDKGSLLVGDQIDPHEQPSCKILLRNFRKMKMN
jgi:hypothetical protein